LCLPTTTDCLCEDCFKKGSDKIDDYITTLTPETIVNNKIAFYPKSPRLIEGIDYYLENNNYVLKLFSSKKEEAAVVMAVVIAHINLKNKTKNAQRHRQLS
jgi:NMD protein affecting ribosome stability and mRNA decay